VSEPIVKFREFMRLERKRIGDGLSPAELRRWMLLKRSLSQKFSPGLSDASADRRDSVRVPTRLAVTFRDLGEVRNSLMTNLNRGGVFIATDEPSDLGTRLELHLHVEETGKEIVVPVEVISQDVGPDLLSDRRGMGLRFLDLDAETSRQISALYERSLEVALEDSD
jgi:uncharacterized protein (TIGR02266 family)